MNFIKKTFFLFMVLFIFITNTFPQNQANVLCDKGTATWCGHCPNAAVIFDDLHTQYGNRAPMIAWHPSSGGDPFGTEFTTFWARLVAPVGYPTMSADHILTTVGAGLEYKNQVAERMAISRELFMSVSADRSVATITVRNDSANDIHANILAVIVENKINYNWGDKTILDFVARLNCYIDNFGDSIFVPAGKTLYETVSYNLSSITYPSGATPATGGAQFQVVAFVYNLDNYYHVYQAAVGNVSSSTCDLKASFSHTSSPANLNVSFTDTSTDSCHTITGWHWDFGDGTVSTQKNPAKTYAKPDYYVVTLTVTNNAAITKKHSEIVTAGTPCNLTANFIHDANEASLMVDFTDVSTDSCHPIVSWLWNFGDGTSSSQQNPAKTYAAAGIYAVSLTVANNDSPAKTVTTGKKVYVGNIQLTYCPSKSSSTFFSYITGVELGTMVNTSAASYYTDFTATVTPPVLKTGESYNLTITLNKGNATNWFKAYIDFDKDGTFDGPGEVIYSTPDPKKVISDGGPIVIPSYAIPGYTRMRIQVKDSSSNTLPSPFPCETFQFGEVEDYKVKIETGDCPEPMANFTYSTLGNLKIQFTDTSSAGAGATLTEWLYHFGAGPDYLGTSTLQHPQFTFPNSGFFPCCLDVTNHCGKSAGICIAVEVPEVQTAGDDIIGVFPSVGGLWRMENTGSSFSWSQLSKQQPDMIRMGDVNGNGIDDLGCWFKSTQKFWMRYDNGTWADVPASAKDMICFDLGDINHDGQADIIGSWTFGTWWKNTATGVWAKLSTMSPSYLAAGDFDGDGYCDMVGLYPTLNSLWIYRYNGNQWTQISKQINLNDLRTGDFDHDGKAEVLGSWNIGTWTFNPLTNAWIKHSSNQASVLCAGDVNGLGKDDIIGDWSPNAIGLWIKYLENGQWNQASKQVPTDICSGKSN